MPSYLLSDPNGGVWAFNPDGIYLIVRAAVRAKLIRQRARVVEYDPGFLLPSTWSVEVNWSGFRQELERETRALWAESEMHLRTDPRSFRGSLLGLMDECNRNTEAYRTMVSRASQRSSDNIGRVVDNWETALNITRTVRDGSATFLIVTAGILSGGTGLAAAGAAGMTGVSTTSVGLTLATGSAMRGVFTYQETGSVGAAVTNGVSSVVVGSIGMYASSANIALNSAQGVRLLILGAAASGGASTAATLFDGKTMKQAAAAGIISAGGQMLGGVVGSRVENMAFFGQALIGTGIDVAGNLGSGAAVEALNPSRAANQGATALPRVTGNVDFVSLPLCAAEQFLTQTALARLR